MHPSSLRAFQRHQEHDLKHTNSMDLIPTKQNQTKQTTFFLHTSGPVDMLVHLKQGVHTHFGPSVSVCVDFPRSSNNVSFKP
jgi:hypothetical protein